MAGDLQARWGERVLDAATAAYNVALIVCLPYLAVYFLLDWPRWTLWLLLVPLGWPLLMMLGFVAVIKVALIGILFKEIAKCLGSLFRRGAA